MSEYELEQYLYEHIPLSLAMHVSVIDVRCKECLHSSDSAGVIDIWCQWCAQSNTIIP